jgi:carboxymethylenebutenolidase
MKTRLGAAILAAAILIAVTACASAPAPIPPTPEPPTAPTSAPPRTLSAPPTNTAVPASTPTPGMTTERVTFKSGDLVLEGFLYKPRVQGPFPALVWNHGSEQDPDPPAMQEFPGIASVFVPQGYIVFAPVRRGQGKSQGLYIVDQTQQERKTKGDAAADKLLVELMETQQLDDQLAGQAYLKSLPYVDKNRLGVIGCSYGGIQTLLAAERGAGYKAAVAMSPAAESWLGNPLLQQRLIKAVSGINMPVILIHPAKDASLLPGPALAQEFQRLGKPYELKIYPPIGTPEQQSHCFGGAVAHGQEIWAADVLAFLQKNIR